MNFSYFCKKLKMMNTDTFPTKSIKEHQKMSNASIAKPMQYHTLNEFRQLCKADLTRLLKKHGRI